MQQQQLDLSCEQDRTTPQRIVEQEGSSGEGEVVQKLEELREISGERTDGYRQDEMAPMRLMKQVVRPQAAFPIAEIRRLERGAGPNRQTNSNNEQLRNSR